MLLLFSVKFCVLCDSVVKLFAFIRVIRIYPRNPRFKSLLFSIQYFVLFLIIRQTSSRFKICPLAIASFSIPTSPKYASTK